MQTNILKYIAVLLAALSLAACMTPSMRGDVYDRKQARRLQNVEQGVIVSIRPVKLEGTHSGSGSLAGGLLGGVAGGAIGHGYGQVAGAAVGAVAGALIGDAIEQGVTSSNGYEAVVKLNSGKSIAVMQEGNPNEFHKGQRVVILHDRRGDARIAPYDASVNYDNYDNYDNYESYSNSAYGGSDGYRNENHNNNSHINNDRPPRHRGKYSTDNYD